MRTRAERRGGAAAGPDGSEEALRQQAEEIARTEGVRSPEDLATLSPEDVGQLLHELRVHQIELEMQNEELRRAQAELDASRARYFDLFDLAPVGYVTVDQQGTIQEANHTAATMLGVARGALVGRSIRRFLAAEDQDAYYRRTRMLVKSGEPQAFGLRLVRADGSRFWARIETRAAPAAESGTPAIRATISDDSADHNAAEERERLRVQLVQAERLAALGRLAGGVAHDFNNMLTVILGYVEMALGSVDPSDPLHDDLETVRDAARRSADLTVQLLASAGRQVVEPRIVDLNEALTIPLRMVGRLLGEQIEIVWRPTADLWATLIDPRQIDRVLTNLCVNARDATGGSGRIEVSTANVVFGEDERAAPDRYMPGEWVRLSVQDEGGGMSAEVAEHAFEPYFTTKDAAGGHGLGLAMVHGIAEQAGGFVDVQSRPGQGSTFSVYLPRSGRPSDDADRHPPGSLPPGELRRGSGETVLLVEDEPAVLRLVGEQLGRLGYVVLLAGTAEEAVRVAQTHAGPIDLILSDVVLPGASGTELVEQVGQVRPRAGRLLMSGYPASVMSRDTASLGRVALLSKPFTAERLAAAVGAALDARSPADPPPTHG